MDPNHKAKLDAIFGASRGPASTKGRDYTSELDAIFGGSREPSAVESTDPDSLGSYAKAGVEGFTEGVTFGFKDEIMGGVNTLAAKAQGHEGEWGDTYEHYRNAARKEHEENTKDHPWVAGLGEVAGGFAVPGLGAIKGATTAARALKSAGAAGLYGAGKSEGETLGEVGMDAAKAAALGGGLSLGIDKVVAPGLSAAGRGAKNLSRKAYSRALGMGKGELNKLEGSLVRKGQSVDGFLDEVADSGLVKFGDNAKNVADRAAQQSDDVGAKVAGTLDELDNVALPTDKVNPQKVAARMEEEVLPLYDGYGHTGERNAVKKLINDMRNRGEDAIDLAEANMHKRSFDKHINYERPLDGSMPIPEEARRKIRRILNEEMEAVADNVSSAAPEASDLANKWKQYKKLYGFAETVERHASRGAKADQGRMGIGLTDLMKGGILGSSTGSPILGIGGALASSVTRGRMASSTAVTLKKISSMLSGGGEALGKFRTPLQNAYQQGGDRAVAVKHHVLQQRSPEYREIIKKAVGE